MGEIVKTVFGGSTSKSKNKAYPLLTEGLPPNIGLGNSAMGTLGSFLGIGDPAAGQEGFQNYLDSTGYASLIKSGSDAIVSNAATKGLLNSGATLKAQTQYGQELAQQKADKYLERLTGLGNYGLGSAGILSDAGKVSKTNDYGKGIFNSLFPGGVSDRRLKTNIQAIGENEDGHVIYHFEFKHLPGAVQTGVMADEVARIQPGALGPLVNGFQTVDYSKIKPVFGLPAFTILTEIPENV